MGELVWVTPKVNGAMDAVPGAVKKVSRLLEAKDPESQNFACAYVCECASGKFGLAVNMSRYNDFRYMGDYDTIEEAQAIGVVEFKFLA